MKLIEEVVVEEFLPTVRSMLAADLRERGLTQSEVAEALGISQSAVSKYAHGEVARNDAVAGDERVAALVERLGEGLATGELSRVGAVVETEVLIRELETGGDLLATLHEAAMPELAEYDGDFTVHDPESRVRTRERTLASVRRGLGTIENASGFASLIPNVGSNLVECPAGAAGVDDVAGVPGRIFDVKGRAAIPGEPEFGVSAHVARVLLAAREAGSDARSALNVRYDRELLGRLRERGHAVAEFDAENDLEASVGRALADTPEASVLYQTGGYGVEPIIYLLGDDAATVAALARELVAS
jgi:predicted fused transcriptional regulator/phosphomethylpyrimidine kinase/predicted transcriptional regulator